MSHEIDGLNEELRTADKSDRDTFWSIMWKRDQAVARECERQAAPFEQTMRSAEYNDKQVETGLAALRECLKSDSYGRPHQYEFKDVKVSSFGRTVWLAVTTGAVNDESNALYLWRKTRYFTIGYNGGITLTNGKGKRSRPVKGLRNIGLAELKY